MKTYLQHFKGAMRTSSQSFLAGSAALIHGFVPFLFAGTASDASLKIENFPFNVTDWSKIPAIEYPGESGVATWRVFQLGEMRLRLVEYSKDYLADHWCSRGHIIFVVEGHLETELKDGRRFPLSAGMSYQVSTNAEPHRSSTSGGAKLFIVD